MDVWLERCRWTLVWLEMTQLQLGEAERHKLASGPGRAGGAPVLGFQRGGPVPTILCSEFLCAISFPGRPSSSRAQMLQRL